MKAIEVRVGFGRSGSWVRRDSSIFMVFIV